MDIFAVNASPTMRRGMTHRLLELVLEGARAGGATVESVFLQKQQISPCLGCLKCWVAHPGRCVQDDDMTRLRQRFAAADLFLLAAPVYVDGFCAQAKTFLDRLIPLVDPHFELVDGHCRHKMLLERVPAIGLVSVCGFSELDNLDLVVEHTRRMCRNLRTRYAGAVLRPASRVLTMQQALPEKVAAVEEAARRAGRELAERGEVSAATAGEVAQPFFPVDLYVDGANLFWDRCLEKKRFPPE